MKEQDDPALVPAETKPSTALQRRPTTMLDLAISKGGSQAVVDTLIEIVETFRHGAIRLTSPEDWLLFRAIDKQSGSELITGYLQDKGCERVAKLYGIRVFDVSDARKMPGDKADDYSYMQTASGSCARTGEEVEKLIGSRSSTDDISAQWRADGMSESQIEIKVQKSCRANLDGNIIRSLTGLNSVPLRELREAWQGTSKDWSQCVRGRGWKGYQVNTNKLSDVGGSDLGDVTAGTIGPKCPKCGSKMNFRKTGKWGPWFSCSKYPQCKGAISQENWEKESSQAAAANTGQEEPPEVEPSKREAVLKSLGKIGQDPDATEATASNGVSVEEFVGNLVVEDLSTGDLLKIEGKLLDFLKAYKEKE